MSHCIDPTLRSNLEDCLRAAFHDEDTQKLIDKQINEITTNIEYEIELALKDNLALSLSYWVAEMAGRAVNALLEGDEQEMRRWLSCCKRDEDGEYTTWNGRSDGVCWGSAKPDHEWHKVIHGTMSENGCVKLRKDIVEAHRDLLVNERIADLEDQVKSLIAQVNKATAEKDRILDRLHNTA